MDGRAGFAFTRLQSGVGSLCWQLHAIPPRITGMEIPLAPELEAKRNRFASRTDKGAGQIVEELVANYFDHDEWFRQVVGKGILSLDQGKFL